MSLTQSLNRSSSTTLSFLYNLLSTYICIQVSLHPSRPSLLCYAFVSFSLVGIFLLPTFSVCVCVSFVVVAQSCLSWKWKLEKKWEREIGLFTKTTSICVKWKEKKEFLLFYQHFMIYVHAYCFKIYKHALHFVFYSCWFEIYFIFGVPFLFHQFFISLFDFKEGAYMINTHTFLLFTIRKQLTSLLMIVVIYLKALYGFSGWCVLDGTIFWLIIYHEGKNIIAIFFIFISALSAHNFVLLSFLFCFSVQTFFPFQTIQRLPQFSLIFL